MEEILLVDNRAQNIELDSENFHIYIGNAQRLIENEFQRFDKHEKGKKNIESNETITILSTHTFFT